MKYYSCFLLVVMAFLNCKENARYAYLDTNLSAEERAIDLVSRMTIDEKIAQLSHLAPGIERLGVKEYGPNAENPLFTKEHPDYDVDELKELMKKRPWENMKAWKQSDLQCLDGGYWNEALHGVARSGLATAFPQCIGLGSTWNPDIIHKMADVASTEARIHNNLYGKKLTYWSPTINILRDPRWGRNEESYSEDPYLLSQMATAFVKGFQGNDPKYIKAIATVKHFVANNSEFNRHNGSSNIRERWLREYYFPAFKSAIVEGGAMSVMSAYNAVNDLPVSANSWLLNDVLREEWDFKGFVVSDCGAISDLVHGHEYETDPEKAVALAVKSGTDLECETCETEQFLYDKYLPNAYKKGYINEAEIDRAVTRLFRARFLLGEFAPKDEVAYTSIPKEELDCQTHRDIAHQIAKESMVLLKNEGILPINKEKINRLAVIGPNANIAELGGYSGSPNLLVTPLQGIKDLVGDSVEIVYEKGCLISNIEEEDDENYVTEIQKTQGIARAVDLAKKSDIAILFVGTNLSIANEATDREDLSLPGNQLKLIQEVFKVNKNIVVVLINGMPLTINWVDQNIPAVLEAWYAGQSQGAAIAETLFGDYNPGGKLPVTFYKSLEDLPHIGDYDITKGRTYWFFEDEVIYPFGHGLSYTNFAYSNLTINKGLISKSDDINIKLSFDLKNTGELKGDEVVQLYVKDIESKAIQPQKKLRRFKRISLEKGESSTISFVLTSDDFKYWDESISNWTIERGKYELQVGSSSRNVKQSIVISLD